MKKNEVAKKVEVTEKAPKKKINATWPFPKVKVPNIYLHETEPVSLPTKKKLKK